MTVNDVLDGQVALDLDCLDRIYLNAYVPNLQQPAQRGDRVRPVGGDRPDCEQLVGVQLEASPPDVRAVALGG